MINIQNILNNKIGYKDVGNLPTFTKIIVLIEPVVLKNAESYFCVAALGEDECIYLLCLTKLEVYGQDLIDGIKRFYIDFLANALLIVHKPVLSEMILEDLKKQGLHPEIIMRNVSSDTTAEAASWLWQTNRIKFVGDNDTVEFELTSKENSKFEDILNLATVYLAEINLKK